MIRLGSWCEFTIFFPKDEKLLEIWTARVSLREQKTKWQGPTRYTICSDHFTDDDFEDSGSQLTIGRFLNVLNAFQVSYLDGGFLRVFVEGFGCFRTF